jgi:hypothetical protein
MTVVEPFFNFPTETGLTEEEKERAKLPKPLPPEQRGTREKCAVCGRPVEDDGFCATQGAFHERWLCDQHVHEMRGAGQSPLIPNRPPMTRKDIEAAISRVKGAIDNLGFIFKVDAMDSSGASRGFDIPLTFRQSRPIFKTILKVLELKYSAFPPDPPPFQEAEPDDSFAESAGVSKPVI